MATNLTEGRIKDFIAALKKMGGSSGNGNLRHELNWDEELYWKVQGRLIGEGRLSAGRGMSFPVCRIQEFRTKIRGLIKKGFFGSEIRCRILA